METQIGIPENILKEFKDRMKIAHSAEDENLKRILCACWLALNHSCGTFGFENGVGMELVYERARYVYNDSLEFFAANFQTELLNFSISLMQQENGGHAGNVI